MKNKMKCVILGITMICFSTIISPVVSTQNVVLASEKESRTNFTEWRFKVIDGHLYKRLYNLSTGEWETDWILVQ